MYFIRCRKQTGSCAERRVGRCEYNVHSELLGATHVHSSTDRRRGKRDQNHQTRPLAFRAHIGDKYYVSVTSGSRDKLPLLAHPWLGLGLVGLGLGLGLWLGVGLSLLGLGLGLGVGLGLRLGLGLGLGLLGLCLG